jgi:hypothetical protein
MERYGARGSHTVESAYVDVEAMERRCDGGVEGASMESRRAKGIIAGAGLPPRMSSSMWAQTPRQRQERTLVHAAVTGLGTKWGQFRYGAMVLQLGQWDQVGRL